MVSDYKVQLVQLWRHFNLHGMSIVQYSVSPTVADEADEPS